MMILSKKRVVDPDPVGSEFFLQDPDPEFIVLDPDPISMTKMA